MAPRQLEEKVHRQSTGGLSSATIRESLNDNGKHGLGLHWAPWSSKARAYGNLMEVSNFSLDHVKLIFPGWREQGGICSPFL